MTTINELSGTDTLAGGDQIVVWSTANGDTRRTSLTALTAYLEPVIGTPQEVLQYASPTTGQTVAVAQANPTWLVLTPAATLAALTIDLGPLAHLKEVKIFSTRIITALTMTGLGAPTTLAANGYAAMKYDAVLDVWRRVA